MELPSATQSRELEASESQPAAEILPPRRDAMASLVETLSHEAASKNQQLNRLLDALVMSIAHGRESYEREIASLQEQLNHAREERELDKQRFEARVNAGLEDVRAERDHLRSRIRELELARDSLTQVIMTERRRGLFSWLFRR